MNVALATANGDAWPSPTGAALAGTLGFFAVGVSLVLFIRALRHLGSARTGAYFSLAPFIGAVLAIGLLGEAVTARLGLAAVLMALGLWLHLTERHEHPHSHEELEHDHVHSHDEHHDHSHDGPVTEPHGHLHRHAPMVHAHVHYPDLHHRHGH